MNLTTKQVDELRKAALEVVYEDALQNEDYLYQICADWVADIPVEELPRTITDDIGYLKLYIDFNPETGEPWKEDE